jgi:hypothetical protein
LEEYLIYVNNVGINYKKDYVYEFLFSDEKDIKKIDGEGWDEFPASGRPEPPTEELITSVGVLTSYLKLDVIQNSDTFAVWDAVDGVIPLAFENMDDYEVYPDSRLHFHFGISKKEVKDKLYAKDLSLIFNKEKK